MMRAVLAAVLLSACATVGVVPTNAPPHPLHPRPAKDVEIVHEAPTTPYIEVANLDAPSDDDWFEMLREKAAELGCDVLWLRTGVGDPYSGICLVYTQVRAADGPPGSF